MQYFLLLTIAPGRILRRNHPRRIGECNRIFRTLQRRPEILQYIHNYRKKTTKEFGVQTASN